MKTSTAAPSTHASPAASVMTPQFCSGLCKGFKFFGVQGDKGENCFCGNDYGNQGGKVPNEPNGINAVHDRIQKWLGLPVLHEPLLSALETSAPLVAHRLPLGHSDMLKQPGRQFSGRDYGCKPRQGVDLAMRSATP